MRPPVASCSCSAERKWVPGDLPCSICAGAGGICADCRDDGAPSSTNSRQGRDAARVAASASAWLAWPGPFSACVRCGRGMVDRLDFMVWRHQRREPGGHAGARVQTRRFPSLCRQRHGAQSLKRFWWGLKGGQAPRWRIGDVAGRAGAGRGDLTGLGRAGANRGRRAVRKRVEGSPHHWPTYLTVALASRISGPSPRTTQVK